MDKCKTVMQVQIVFYLYFKNLQQTILSKQNLYISLITNFIDTWK